MGLFASIILRRPFNVLIQVTNRCNMRCSFCNFWKNALRPEQELTTNDYFKISEELSRIGRFGVSIEGGEPLLRSDIVDIVSILSRKNLSVLYTNGWHVDQDIAKSLFRAGLLQAGVSIDYPDPALHDQNRSCEKAFEKACNAIDHFRMAAPSGGKQVHVMTVLMRDNQNVIEELLRLSDFYKVGHYITLLSAKGSMRSGKKEMPSPDISKKLIILRSENKHFKVFSEYLELTELFLYGQSMPPCLAGNQSFNIDHRGNVSPCIEKIDSPVGNIIYDGIGNILPRLKAAMKTSYCQDCWSLCRGFSQILGNGADIRSLLELCTRMKSY